MNNIDKLCKKYNIKNYTINEDGSIDVDGNVDLSYAGLTKLPLKFNKVSGYFDCHNNKLTTLDGCPKYISKYFLFSFNKLTNLDGFPNVVQLVYCDNMKELWDASSDVFKVLHANEHWVNDYNLWNLRPTL